MSENGKKLRAVILFLLIALPILAAAAWAVFWFVLDQPFGDPKSAPVEFVVKNGVSFDQIAPDLESRGLVADSRYPLWRFKILSRLGAVPPLQAGRYSLKPGLKPSEIISSLTSPLGAQRIYTTLTVPPGLSAAGFARRVEESGLARSEDVMDAVRDLTDDYPILVTPEGLQGYLFPDTYKFETPLDSGRESSRSTARQVVRSMADKFFDVLDSVDPNWVSLTEAQLHEKVTLASIIEREYRVEEEAPLIGAVFNNRLNEGMRLESCATVVYVIEDTSAGEPYQDEYLKFNRRIFLRYLDIQSGYNTYRNTGLPPGPISLPGRSALEASFFPADSNALFFVVKNPEEGTHVFSRDYSDHLDARESYLNQYVVKD